SVAGFRSGINLASAELYEPASGTWTATGSLTAARNGHTATLLPDGKLLVAGGSGDSGALTSAELYNSASGTWTETDSLDTGRYSHTTTLLADGKALVAGGWTFISGDYFTASAELYDSADGHWNTVSHLNDYRTTQTATLLPDGNVLVAGGWDDFIRLATAELYDPGSSNWSITASLIDGRSAHTATLLSNGYVLVAGGFGN